VPAPECEDQDGDPRSQQERRAEIQGDTHCERGPSEDDRDDDCTQYPLDSNAFVEGFHARPFVSEV
jgi:hypothetical protein